MITRKRVLLALCLAFLLPLMVLVTFQQKASQMLSGDDNGIPACHRYWAIVNGDDSDQTRGLAAEGFRTSNVALLRRTALRFEYNQSTPYDTVSIEAVCARFK